MPVAISRLTRALAVALVLAGCAATGADEGGSRAIVLVSGRDDHGLLQLSEVPLYTEPEGTEEVGRLPDGSFAEVLEVRGTWLEIRSLGKPSVTGWIDDFFLRDRVLLHNTEQVRLLGARAGETVEIEVQLVEVGGDPFWIGVNHLTEVGADVEPHEH